MSVSATTAAKRRRAGNIVSTPLFKPSSAPMENSVQRRANINQPIPRQQTVQQPIQQISQQTENVNNQANTQRPMSLQQVISVFDKRLLHIEGIILKNASNNNELSTVDNSIITKDMETLKESIRENLDGQFSEFDHRYQLLANEISSLKQIVLKLQGYSLEINKSLMDERNEILSKLDNVQQKVEDTIDASTNTIEEENITFDISSSDVKQEFIENTNGVAEEEVVDQQIAEPKNNDDIMEDVEAIDEVAESTEETIVNTKECCDEKECCDGGECCDTKECCNEKECCDGGECCDTKECCDGGECCDTKECCDEKECCTTESDKVVEKDVSNKNEKTKRKKKQKNVIAVSV